MSDSPHIPSDLAGKPTRTGGDWDGREVVANEAGSCFAIVPGPRGGGVAAARAATRPAACAAGRASIRAATRRRLGVRARRGSADEKGARRRHLRRADRAPSPVFPQSFGGVPRGGGGRLPSTACGYSRTFVLSPFFSTLYWMIHWTGVETAHTIAADGWGSYENSSRGGANPSGTSRYVARNSRRGRTLSFRICPSSRT